VRGLKHGGTMQQHLTDGGRAPYGVRGLKLLMLGKFHAGFARRAPYGVRGLKLYRQGVAAFGNKVAPRMGCVD